MQTISGRSLVWLHGNSCAVGVSVNADSRFSGGVGLRQCCAPARQGSGGVGDVEGKGRLPGRIAARPAWGKENEEES